MHLQEHCFRSSERYWIASRMSVARMLGAPARSANHIALQRREFALNQVVHELDEAGACGLLVGIGRRFGGVFAVWVSVLEFVQ